MEPESEDVRVDVEENVEFKQEMNVSQASSCDYSLSQFNPNESQFSAVKTELSYEDPLTLNDSNAHNVSIKRDFDHAEDNNGHDVSVLHIINQ